MLSVRQFVLLLPWLNARVCTVAHRNDWCDEGSARELFDRNPDLQRHPDSPGVLQEDGTIVGGCPDWQSPHSRDGESRP